jgi:hypothetical protein
MRRTGRKDGIKQLVASIKAYGRSRRRGAPGKGWLPALLRQGPNQAAAYAFRARD